MGKIVLDRIAYEAHPVSPERKRELNARGFKIIDARFAPADARSIADDGDGYPPDDELRAAIETATGKAPHHKAGRPKLIEQYEAIKAAARQDEVAANGLTRREIEADLTAMEVEFSADDQTEDLAALRDKARAGREGNNG